MFGTCVTLLQFVAALLWKRPQRRRARSTRRFALEHLDQRALCTVGLNPTGEVLVITGTEAADRVIVSNTSSTITVNDNGQTTTWNRSGVSRIDFHGLSGNDVYNGKNVTIRQNIYGENGNDSLSGGGHNDLLFGGHGRDSLSGNGRNDRLNGGPDVDTLNGGTGADSYFAQDGLADRLIGVSAEDIVYGDTLGTIRPSHTQNDRDNTVFFFGNHFAFSRETVPGVQGTFYRVRINGTPYGDLWRAANRITVYIPRDGSMTIDPQLRSELDVRGWLRIETLA